MQGSEGYHNLMFWVFAATAVLPGLGILIAKDIVRQAFWLLLSLVGFACLYLLMGADFLGFTQVVVYIGGILILFLFGVMLTHRTDVPLKEVRGWNLVVPGIVAGLLSAAALLHVAYRTEWNTEASAVEPTTSAIGQKVMSTYLLPFEIVSILLLVALVGATYIARRGGEKGESE